MDSDMNDNSGEGDENDHDESAFVTIKNKYKK